MRFYNATLFCEEPIYAHIDFVKNGYWPVTIRINASIKSSLETPDILLFMKDLGQLIAFKNSVIAAVDAIEMGD